MLTIALAGFSFLAGMAIPFVGSVALVLYFSTAAATIIAICAYVYGSTIGAVAIAWLVTIFSVQFGFVVSAVMTGLAKANNWQQPFKADGQQADFRDPAENAPLQKKSERGPVAVPTKSRNPSGIAKF